MSGCRRRSARRLRSVVAGEGLLFEDLDEYAESPEIGNVVDVEVCRWRIVLDRVVVVGVNTPDGALEVGATSEERGSNLPKANPRDADGGCAVRERSDNGRARRSVHEARSSVRRSGPRSG